MDAHLVALRRIDFVDHLAHGLDRIVLATVVVAHDADDAERVLVDRFAHGFGIELERVR